MTNIDAQLVAQIATSAFPNTFSSGVLGAVNVVREHTASVTVAVDEAEDGPRDADGEYIGDKRQCACGELLDGYYEYQDHLLALLGAARP